MTKTKKKMKGRPRGGASCPCPECSGHSEVIVTKRVDLKVLRERKCLSRECGARFRTVEKFKELVAS